MIVISGTVKVKSDKREEAVEYATAMAAATRQEPGCRFYGFYSDIEDPDTFRIFEEWDSVEALRAHFQTPHMATFNRQIEDVVAGPFDIVRYDVSGKTSDFLADP